MHPKSIEDGFYQIGVNQFAQTIIKLLKDHPELAEPCSPGSIEEQKRQKIQQRLADLSKLTKAEVEAYYLEYSQV